MMGAPARVLQKVLCIPEAKRQRGNNPKI